MAQRKYEQFQLSLEKQIVNLYGNVSIGATGAVGTLTAVKNQGILSVVRNSTGNYTITLGNSAQSSIDKYQRLIGVDVQILLSGISVVSNYQITTDAVLASGTITLQFVGPTSSSVTTPIAVDPDNGAVLLISILVKNSTV